MLNPTQIVNHSKKGSSGLAERNVNEKWNVETAGCCWLTRMSSKVNSSRLRGCFKNSQIQQKLFAHEALSKKLLLFFFGKLDISRENLFIAINVYQTNHYSNDRILFWPHWPWYVFNYVRQVFVRIGQINP